MSHLCYVIHANIGVYFYIQVRSSSTCFMEDLNSFLQGRFEEGLPLPPEDFKSAALVYYYQASRSDYARPDCDRDGDLMWLKAEFKTRLPTNTPFNEIEAFFGP